MTRADTRYCRTCGADFGRLYDEPIQCDMCCGAERQAAQMQPVIDALRAELAEARMKASRVPGLTAELDEVRWERDLAMGEPSVYAQALAELDRRAIHNQRLRDTIVAATTALGEAWLYDGATLADGIERKTRALESMPGARALTLLDAILAAHRDDIPPRLVEALSTDEETVWPDDEDDEDGDA